MTMRITTPGIYLDMASEDYFGDPAPVPSLSQSIAKILLECSPAHAAAEHPRLAPPIEPEDETADKYDAARAIGNSAHAMLIGRGKGIATGEFPTWQTKASKEWRAEQELAGAEVILAKHQHRAASMVASARKQFAAHEAKSLFDNGRGEVALLWEEDGVWFRTLIDWLHDDLRTVDDYKTGALSAAPHTIPMRMVNAGWDVQAAIQERGLDILDPGNAGRRKFRFIVQENESPFAVSVSELPESTMTMGRKKLAAAVSIWRQCMARGEWPAYPPLINRPAYPGFKEAQWLDREMSEFGAVGVPGDNFNILRAG